MSLGRAERPCSDLHQRGRGGINRTELHRNARPSARNLLRARLWRFVAAVAAVVRHHRTAGFALPPCPRRCRSDQRSVHCVRYGIGSRGLLSAATAYGTVAWATAVDRCCAVRSVRAALGGSRRLVAVSWRDIVARRLWRLARVSAVHRMRSASQSGCSACSPGLCFSPGCTTKAAAASSLSRCSTRRWMLLLHRVWQRHLS